MKVNSIKLIQVLKFEIYRLANNSILSFQSAWMYFTWELLELIMSNASWNKLSSSYCTSTSCCLILVFHDLPKWDWYRLPCFNDTQYNNVMITHCACIIYGCTKVDQPRLPMLKQSFKDNCYLIFRNVKDCKFKTASGMYRMQFWYTLRLSRETKWHASAGSSDSLFRDKSEGEEKNIPWSYVKI